MIPRSYLITSLTLAHMTGCAMLLDPTQPAQKACTPEVDTLTALPADPPARFDGEWQCMYTMADGAQFVESLTYVQTGDRVLITGRDNYNNNITMDAHAGGRVVTFRSSKFSGWRLTMDPSGRILDGELKLLGDANGCFTTRYICRRRG
ncbi:MAG TPA: hypothetical protein VFQ53_33900 [Kofleriaceae bacterium]|nr:hypothetical protein [Kofleriaceae bacterium]